MGELLFVLDDPIAMGEVEALAVVLDLECLQSLVLEGYWAIPQGQR